MYYLVKTYEEVSSFEALAVQLRIHNGSLESIENYWSAWNGKHKEHRRYDKIVYSSESFSLVTDALSREYARIFKGRKKFTV